jgi:hypothetical protein
MRFSMPLLARRIPSKCAGSYSASYVAAFPWLRAETHSPNTVRTSLVFPSCPAPLCAEKALGAANETWAALRGYWSCVAP